MIHQILNYLFTIIYTDPNCIKNFNPMSQLVLHRRRLFGSHCIVINSQGSIVLPVTWIW